MSSTHFLLLLLALAAASTFGADFSIPGCFSKAALETLSAEDPESFPRCFCDRSDFRLHSVPDAAKRVTVECSLIPYVSNLTDAIQAVVAAGHIVDVVDLRGFNFDPEVGLPDDYFKDLGATKLRYLKIDVCERDEVNMSRWALRGLENSLVKISVTQCVLPKIPEAFQDIKSLEVLHLVSANVDAMLEDSFKGLDNLKELNVGENRLRYFESGTLEPLRDLQNLTLGPRNDFNATIWEEVNRLGPSMRYLQMTNLDLRHDDLDSEIMPPNALSNLTGLETLDLTRNYINTIDVDAFEGLWSLQRLDMRVNYLHEINWDPFRNLKNLTHLDLSGNYLEEITNFTFRGLTNLKYLGLSHQEFSFLGSGIFEDLESVERMALNSNFKLRDLEPRTFYGLNSLKHLNLSSTDIQKFPHQVLEWVPELVELDLHNSSIKFLDREDFAPVEYLNAVNLSKTYLQSIPPRTLEHLPLEHLDLSQNAWICDDRMRDLVEDIDWRYDAAIKAGVTFTLHNENSTLCYRPWPLHGKRVMEQNHTLFTYWNEKADTTTSTTTTTTSTKAPTTTTTEVPKSTKRTTEAPLVTRKALPNAEVARGGFGSSFQEEDAEKAKQRGTVGVVVGVIVAALVTLLVIAVVVMTIRRRRKQAQEEAEKSSHQPNNSTLNIGNGQTNLAYNGSAVYKKSENGVELCETPAGKVNGSAIVRTQPND